MKPHESKRLIVGSALTLAAWLSSSAAYAWLENLDFSWWGTRGDIITFVLILLAGLFTVMLFWIFPIVLVLGVMKLRDQKRFELEQLGDENKVLSDEDGERKLHQYLTAITSVEARIGLVQQPDPWPGSLEPRPAAPRMRFTQATRRTVGTFVVAGVLGSMVLAGVRYEVPVDGVTSAFFVYLAAAGLIGCVFATFLGWIAAMLFGSTETISPTETTHDTGTGGSEAT
jgi:hypothetical protein